MATTTQIIPVDRVERRLTELNAVIDDALEEMQRFWISKGRPRTVAGLYENSEEARQHADMLNWATAHPGCARSVRRMNEAMIERRALTRLLKKSA